MKEKLKCKNCIFLENKKNHISSFSFQCHSGFFYQQNIDSDYEGFKLGVDIQT